MIDLTQPYLTKVLKDSTPWLRYRELKVTPEQLLYHDLAHKRRLIEHLGGPERIIEVHLGNDLPLGLEDPTESVQSLSRALSSLGLGVIVKPQFDWFRPTLTKLESVGSLLFGIPCPLVPTQWPSARFRSVPTDLLLDGAMPLKEILHFLDCFQAIAHTNGPLIHKTRYKPGEDTVKCLIRAWRQFMRWETSVATILMDLEHPLRQWLTSASTDLDLNYLLQQTPDWNALSKWIDKKYLPVLGQVPNLDFFHKHYKTFKTQVEKRIAAYQLRDQEAYFVRLSVHTHDFLRLGSHSFDKTSCFKHGSTYHNSPGLLANHPDTFAVYVYRGAVNATCRIARAWGAWQPDRWLLANIYGGSPEAMYTFLKSVLTPLMEDPNESYTQAPWEKAANYAMRKSKVAPKTGWTINSSRNIYKVQSKHYKNTNAEPPLMLDLAGMDAIGKAYADHRLTFCPAPDCAEIVAVHLCYVCGTIIPCHKHNSDGGKHSSQILDHLCSEHLACSSYELPSSAFLKSGKRCDYVATSMKDLITHLGSYHLLEPVEANEVLITLSRKYPDRANTRIPKRFTTLAEIKESLGSLYNFVAPTTADATDAASSTDSTDSTDSKED